jgi:3',5'-cyclic AMP phosphodiesterase CpdA
MSDHVYEKDAGEAHRWVVSRRVFLRSAVAVLAAPTVLSLSCAQDGSWARRRKGVRFGIVTDCHYADVGAAGTRFYRASLNKLGECIARMNAERVDFLIELGDFKDQDRPPVEAQTLAYLDEVEAVFQQFDGPTYHVLGNHDMDSISKPQFLSRVTNTSIAAERSYYSFDANGLHCVVLDANFSANGAQYDHGRFDWTDANIPPRELAWLRDDLAKASGPVVVFVHQLLDGSGDVYIANAAEVRDVLEDSDKVLAVFQGHHHSGAYTRVNGIHYYTLIATVEGQGPESNSYAIVEVQPNLNAVVTGYRKAKGRTLKSCRGNALWLPGQAQGPAPTGRSV